MIKAMTTELLKLSRTTKSQRMSELTKQIAENISDEEFGRALGTIQDLAALDPDTHRQVAEIVRLETALWSGVVPERKP